MNKKNTLVLCAKEKHGQHCAVFNRPFCLRRLRLNGLPQCSSAAASRPSAAKPEVPAVPVPAVPVTEPTALWTCPYRRLCPSPDLPRNRPPSSDLTSAPTHPPSSAAAPELRRRRRLASRPAAGPTAKTGRGTISPVPASLIGRAVLTSQR